MNTGDVLRRMAAEQWRQASKLEPVRNLALLRVAHAEALAAIEGEGAGRRAAGSQAAKALQEVLRAYPEHPRAGGRSSWRGPRRCCGRARPARVWRRCGGWRLIAAAPRRLSGRGGAGGRWQAAALVGVEQIDRAEAARRLRRFATSRALLDELLADPQDLGGAASGRAAVAGLHGDAAARLRPGRGGPRAIASCQSAELREAAAGPRSRGPI